jgi:hypothetical protein
MNKTIQNVICIIVLGVSIGALLYFYWTTPTIKEGATTDAPVSSTQTFTPCGLITTGQADCINNQYATGRVCIYNPTDNRCIRPAVEYNADGTPIDDGTNGPDNYVGEVSEVDTKSGL